jgi:hypothetical protein
VARQTAVLSAGRVGLRPVREAETLQEGENTEADTQNIPDDGYDA